MKNLHDAITEINKNLNGQAPQEIITDSKIYRFGKKDSCWYAANMWEYKGSSYFTVNYGDWKTGQEFTFKSFDQKQSLDKNFITAQKKKTEENQARLKHEKETLQKECREKWTPKFKQAHQKFNHEYLENKKIKDLYTARIDHNNTLLIPIYDHERMQGVQMIFRDPDTQEFTKRFARGIKIKGGFCPLKPFKNAEYIYLSEGFATAASVQMAFPNIPSICAFNAGNLLHAINSIRHVNPACKIIIAADNDQNHEGEKKARYCTKVYADTIYKKVIFLQNSPKEWTDFNDLHCFESLTKVKEQLEFDENDFAFIEPLGHDEESGHYFYVSSTNSQVVPIAAGSHNKSNLARIIPNLNYWEKHYGSRDEETEKINISWQNAQFDLMEKCQKIGEFNPNKVRGVGVWKDRDNYVFNNGIRVFNKPDNSSYVYRKGSKVSTQLVDNLDYDKINKGLKNVFKAIDNLQFKNGPDSIYLAAWIIQAQIFSVMPWRFHIWITGDKGSGKSTIMEKLAAIAPFSEFTDDATESGISQTIKSNATAIVYDEFEASHKNEVNKKVKGILDLARRMSRNTGAKKLRGSAGGNAISHNTQCVFIFGSITKESLSPADASRFFFIELENTKNQDPREWQAIESILDSAIAGKNKLFSACFHNLDTIVKNFKFTSLYLKNSYKMESRFSDQLGSLLACFHVYKNFDLITESEIDFYIEEFDLLKSEYIEQNKTDDSENAYNNLMKTVLDIRENLTLENIIEKIDAADNSISKDETQRILSVYGMRYEEGKNLLFIGNDTYLKNLEKKIGSLSIVSLLRSSSKYCTEKRVLVRSSDKVMRGSFIKII